MAKCSGIRKGCQAKEIVKMVIDEILAFNERFLQSQQLPTIGHAPRKRMAVVTCMDCRLVRMFEQALGLERGDVLELRTAGATISQPERSPAANDLIRSLAGGIYLLGVREVAVIGHTQCGLSHVDPTVVTASMQALGVDPQALLNQEGLSDINDLTNWLGAFSDVHVNVREVVNVIRNSPYLPKIPVHGLVIDINTGKLEVIDRSA
jgi:carbonic anhydrase